MQCQDSPTQHHLRAKMFASMVPSHSEVTKLIQRENEEVRMVAMIRLGSTRTTRSNLSGFKVQFHPGGKSEPAQSSRSTLGRHQLRAQARDSTISPPHQKSRVQPPSENLETSVPVPTRDPVLSSNPLGVKSSVLLGQGSPESPPGFHFGQGSPPPSPVVLSGQGSHPSTPTVLSGQGKAAVFPPDLASSSANLAPEAPAVAVAPEVTAGTPLEELDVSGAKPKTRFTLPFDFPNPFTFRKPEPQQQPQ
jgi:hypothetical protein